MPVASAFAIYFVLWWIVLFAVLPFGVRNQAETGEAGVAGNDPGAPVRARMLWKLKWTTIISLLIFAPFMLAYYQGWLNVDHLSNLMGLAF
jgi:predicted secreted protein